MKTERAAGNDRPEFRKELETAINRHSMENGSCTPDFILSMYLVDCLIAFDKAVMHRENVARQADERNDARQPPGDNPMTAQTRIYLITQRADSEAAPVQCRLVRAPHPANALRHVAAAEFSVAVASQDDLIVCLSNGVKVETAGEDRDEHA